MLKGRRTDRSSRSGSVVVMRPRKDLIALLPQELVDLIINNVHGYRSLLSCSLVCRAFMSHTREILFRRISLSCTKACDRLLLLPRSTLVCIKAIRIPPSMAGDIFNFVKDTLNRPSFPQLMGQLGPLRLALPHLPWSQLNDDARRALSTHAFCSIRLGGSRFLSVADLCEFLHSSPELETLALEYPNITDTSIPTSPQHHRRVPSVLRLRLNDYNTQSSILKVIVDARACLVSFDRLRHLDVTISSTEALAILQNILDTSDTLEILKVSHVSYNSHKGQLPYSHLSLKRLHRLDLILDDTNDGMSTTVQANLFEWWRAVWADSKFTSVEELSITTRLMSPPDGDYDVTIWPKIGAALSCPAWARLSALSIVIYTWAGCDAESKLHSYKEVIQQAMDSSSANISIVLQYLEDDDDPDYAIHSEEWQEDVNVGYRDW